MEFVGIIKAITPPLEKKKKRDGSVYKVCQVVIEEPKEQFPNSIVISCIDEKIEKLAGMQVGASVKVIFNASAKGVNGSYYNNLTLYKITRVEMEQQPQQPQMPKAQAGFSQFQPQF